MLIAKIIKIDDTKLSKNAHLGKIQGHAFKRVYFKVKDFQRDETFWAKTDLVSQFRNWKNWKDLLQVGNYISGIKMRDDDTIDADSSPKIERRGMDNPKERALVSEDLNELVELKSKQSSLFK